MYWEALASVILRVPPGMLLVSMFVAFDSYG